MPFPPRRSIHPAVADAHAREVETAFQASQRSGLGMFSVQPRSMEDIAASLGVPMIVLAGPTPDEIAIARATLDAATRGETWTDVETSYGSAGQPVDARTVARAAALLASLKEAA